MVCGAHSHYSEVLCSEILNLEEEEFLLSLIGIYREQQKSSPTGKLVQEEGYKKVIIDAFPLIYTDADQIVVLLSHIWEI